MESGQRQNLEDSTKGGFFSESAIRFSKLQISKKKIFQKTILNLKFKLPANNTLLGNLNFKLRIVFGIFFLEIWRFEKEIALSEKKPPLPNYPKYLTTYSADIPKTSKVFRILLKKALIERP